MQLPAAFMLWRHRNKIRQGRPHMLSDADISENAAYALHFEVASQLI
jgi:hypothetical protein